MHIVTIIKCCLCVNFSPQQGTYGIHQSRLTLCDMSRTASSPSLPFSSTSLPPEWDLASQHADSNRNRVFFLANDNPVHKSVTPEPLSDKPACASIPAAEVAKIQDYPSPQPIPKGKNGWYCLYTQVKSAALKFTWAVRHCTMWLNFKQLWDSNLRLCLCVLAEMLCGWWRVSDMLELQDVVKALHGRGIRERVLQKQIQKHMGYMIQLFANSKDGWSTCHFTDMT